MGRFRGAGAAGNPTRLPSIPEYFDADCTLALVKDQTNRDLSQAFIVEYKVDKLRSGDFDADGKSLGHKWSWRDGNSGVILEGQKVKWYDNGLIDMSRFTEDVAVPDKMQYAIKRIKEFMTAAAGELVSEMGLDFSTDEGFAQGFTIFTENDGENVIGMPVRVLGKVKQAGAFVNVSHQAIIAEPATE